MSVRRRRRAKRIRSPSICPRVRRRCSTACGAGRWGDERRELVVADGRRPPVAGHAAGPLAAVDAVHPEDDASLSRHVPEQGAVRVRRVHHAGRTPGAAGERRELPGLARADRARPDLGADLPSRSALRAEQAATLGSGRCRPRSSRSGSASVNRLPRNRGRAHALSTASTFRSPATRSSPSSGRAAAARRPWRACWPGSWPPTADRCSSTANRSSRSASASASTPSRTWATNARY